MITFPDSDLPMPNTGRAKVTIGPAPDAAPIITATYGAILGANTFKGAQSGILKVRHEGQISSPPELIEERDRLRAAIERLGSMEAFSISRPIRPGVDDELIARIDYARSMLEA